MRRPRLVASLGVLLLAAVGFASAQDAYTARPMNVRAGPNRDYPLVAQLDAGAPLDVHGCLNDWSWCDVSFDDSRGWIYAGGVSFVYQGGRVPLYSYGPRLGLPIITFSLMAYWGDHYRTRPWYAQRDDWSHRRMPPRSVPHGRPPVAHGGAPMSRGGMSHGRPAAGGRQAPRSEQHGHAAPQGRPMAQPQHAAPQHGAGPGRSSGHPSSGRTSSHAEHGNDERRQNPP